jgi:hypothetical protein
MDLVHIKDDAVDEVGRVVEIAQSMSRNYPRAFSSSDGKEHYFYSSGRRNSNPNRRISPTVVLRRTRAVIGGVSLGTRLEDVGEGAGTVIYTNWSGCNMCPEAIQAPLEEIFTVLVSSTNSTPEESAPRRNRGT